jgi:tetratricopeptide (TPR) repeat protein
MTLEEPIKHVGRIYLFGRLTLLDALGKDCTPRGKKTKALLALLVLAPRGSRSRVWLRDKLWSDRQEQQAAGSLRQALVELRGCLKQLSNTLVMANQNAVSIDLSQLWVDAYELTKPGSSVNLSYAVDRQPPEFLEGLDVGDSEFEEWLTVERQFWTDKLENFRKPASQPGIHARTISAGGISEDQVTIRCRLGIGLLPCINSAENVTHISLADLVLEAIARNLQELQALDVYDYRDSGTEDFGVPPGDGPDLLLRIRVHHVGNDMNLTLLAYRTTTNKLIWTHSIHADQSEFLLVDAMTVSAFVNQNVDRIAYAFFSKDPDESDPSKNSIKTGYAALNLIFRDDADSLSAAENLLMQAYKRDRQSMYLGFLAYTSSFRVGENLGEFGESERLATVARADEALALNPFNSVTLACIGHVYGYVMRDFNESGELLKQAIEINPHQAFSWDHYALYCIYTGKYEAALAASKRAVQLGSFSPLRYSFETTLAMAATLIGDYRTAIFYAKRALNRQPRFAAAMRYLAVCLGHTGRADDASLVLDRLHAIDPEFSLSHVRQNGMAITDEAGRGRLLRGFELAGLRR